MRLLFQNLHFWPTQRSPAEQKYKIQSIDSKANLICKRCKNHLTRPYRIIWWTILDFEYVHGTNHGLHCHKYILEYQLNKATFIFIGITTTVDNSHLLDKGRFARFTSTCEHQEEKNTYIWENNGKFPQKKTSYQKKASNLGLETYKIPQIMFENKQFIIGVTGSELTWKNAKTTTTSTDSFIEICILYP